MPEVIQLVNGRAKTQTQASQISKSMFFIATLVPAPALHEWDCRQVPPPGLLWVISESPSVTEADTRMLTEHIITCMREHMLTSTSAAMPRYALIRGHTHAHVCTRTCTPLHTHFPLQLWQTGCCPDLGLTILSGVFTLSPSCS